MENKKRSNKDNKTICSTTDQNRSDNDADKSGSDCDSDKTHKSTGIRKFEKPKREVDPDRTGIDTELDKTK